MIEVRHLRKVYTRGAEVMALRDVSVTIDDGEFVAIIGLSGAGKSTFMRCLNRLVDPTSGAIVIDGQDITKLDAEGIRQVRLRIGMIFQEFNLVDRATVLDNVLMARAGYLSTWQSVRRAFPKADRELAFHCLERVGIADKAHQRADALSGGQRQRVGIARALAQEPRVILADEPVASLDPKTARVVMEDLRRINDEDGITTIVNIHFLELAKAYADRIIGLAGGGVVFDGPSAEMDEPTFVKVYGTRPQRMGVAQ